MRRVLQLAKHLENLYGSLARAVCRPRFTAWEVPLAYAFLYNLTMHSAQLRERYPFFETVSVLERAGLKDYATRVMHQTTGGVGEKLLHAYDGNNPQLRAALLNVTDDHNRPLFVYRELPPSGGNSGIRRRMKAQHALVCASKYLFMSVCQEPEEAFFCQSNGTFQRGLPSSR